MARDLGRVKEELVEGNSVTVQVNLPSPDLMPPPVAANYFTLSRVGTLVQFTIGFVDVHAAARLAAHLKDNPSETDKSINVMVTHRIVLDANALADFKGKVDRIVAAMKADGTLPEEESGT
jgi:hypothetical protein